MQASVASSSSATGAALFQRLNPAMVESVKWTAVVAMLLDHINGQLVPASPMLYYIGRIALPLFAIALGVSLMGRDIATIQRAAKRTLIFAIIAQPLSALIREPAPLNILFVLAGGLLIVSQIERRSVKVAISALAALVLSPWAEFSVCGPIMAVAGIYFGRNPSWISATVMVFAVAFLQADNGNHFALLSLPVLGALMVAQVHIPHIRYSMQTVYCGQFPLIWLGKVFA